DPCVASYGSEGTATLGAIVVKPTLGVTCLRSRGWAVSLPCTRAIAPGARLGQQTGRKRGLALGRLLVLHPSAAAARFSAFSHCRSYFHLLLDATGRRASTKLLPQSRHQSMQVRGRNLDAQTLGGRAPACSALRFFFAA